VTSGPAVRRDFLREKVAEDAASNRFGRPIHTRFPPEPNGYLHIGHAKSICLNFGIAAEFAGRCNLRFDDTNPTTEDVRYVDAIRNDVRWLGFEWNEERFASDYFERLYEIAEQLVRAGKAYVDSQSEEGIREGRRHRSRRRARPVRTGIARSRRTSTCCVACALGSSPTALTCCALGSTWPTPTC
jgi:glutaminyl-tRNA synthetase